MIELDEHRVSDLFKTPKLRYAQVQMVLKYCFLDFALAQFSVGVLNSSETRCSSSSIIQLSNKLLGQLIGQCGPNLQWPDGNRPFLGVFQNCTNVRMVSGCPLSRPAIFANSYFQLKAIKTRNHKKIHGRPRDYYSHNGFDYKV